MADRRVLFGQVERAVQGDMVSVGSKAPDFSLIANDFSTRTLADYEGKVKILSVVPSLDTGLCSTQTNRFNQEVAALGDDVIVLAISADLPFAQARWCGAEGAENVEMLSTHKDMKFSDDYGTYLLDLRLNQRSAFVLDKDNVVQYAQYMPITSHEVDYDAVIAKARELVG